jgi:hypothetical protein
MNLREKLFVTGEFPHSPFMVFEQRGGTEAGEILA